jgi:hypothetical protein
LVIGGQKVLCQVHCEDFGAFVIFPGLVMAQLVPGFATKSVFKGQQFTGVEEIASKAIRALTEVSKWFPGKLLKAL